MISTRRLLLILLVSVFCSMSAEAQAPVPELVEVFWKETATLRIPGVTDVLVLDESISRARISLDQIEFFGTSRGETVAFAWVGEQRITLRLRITARPLPPPRPKLSANALDALGNGTAGSALQTVVAPNGETSLLWTHRLDWRQFSDGKRLAVRAQLQNTNAAGLPGLNINSATVSYEKGPMRLSVIDFPLEVNGGMDAKVATYSAYNIYTIRGARVAIQRGRNQFELFGGATVPSYFRSLKGTRDVAGLNFIRKANKRLLVYSTAGWVNSPFAESQAAPGRKNSVFQTAGFSYTPNAQWAVQATAAASTRGSLAEGTVSYSGARLTGFVAATRSAPDFPLNQLQLLFSGGSSVTTGTTFRITPRLAGSAYLQHSATQGSVFSAARGASDYYNWSLNASLTSRQAITFNHTYNRNQQETGPRTQNQRMDLTLHSVLAQRISNTAQLTIGQTTDPTEVNSQSEFTARETLSFHIGKASVNLALQHARRDPSMIRRLHERISLLPLELQESFLLNPGAFLQSADLPAYVRARLESLQPADTQITVTGQFSIGRVNVSPTAGYSQNPSNVTRNSHSRVFGYSLSYPISPTLQLTSTLSNTFRFDPARQMVDRSAVIAFGFQKSFSGTPRRLIPFASRGGTIRGRVFRDLNLDGLFAPGEPGVANVRVDIDQEKTTVTDSQGRFELSGLSPGTHQVRVRLGQFDEAVRLTTLAEVETELIESTTARVDFGVVNFARLTGNIFNDYLLDAKRHPDTNGLRNVRLKLEGKSGVREIVTDGAGDYGLYDIEPGDYALSLDRTTLPANFLGPEEPLHIHVAPITTVVRDIPVRALRSISGHVYLRQNIGEGGSGPSDPLLRPLAGVRLKIGDQIAATDADGSFVLRNLPSGELTLTLVPFRDVPEGLTVPAGRVNLPREPINVENATIVISNPDLPQYLIDVRTQPGAIP